MRAWFLLPLGACSVTEGPRELADEAFNPTAYRLALPASVIPLERPGQLRASPTMRLLLAEHATNEYALVDPASLTSCDLGRADAVEWLLPEPDAATADAAYVATLAEHDADGRGSLKVFDANCREKLVLEAASLPSIGFGDPPQYFVESRSELLSFDSRSYETTHWASAPTFTRVVTTGGQKQLEAVQVVEAGVLRVYSADRSVLWEGGSDVRVINAPSGDDRFASLLAVDGRSVLRLNTFEPWISELPHEVCWLSELSDPTYPVGELCRDEARARRILTGSESDGSSPSLPAGSLRVRPLATGGYHVTEGSVDAATCDISRVDQDGQRQLLLRGVAPLSDIWRPLPGKRCVEAYAPAMKAAGDWLRACDGDSEPQLLASGVYRYPQPSPALPLIVDYDGTRGDWIELNGLETLERRVVATGVVPDGGFAPDLRAASAGSELTARGWFAFLSEFDGTSGELQLARTPSVGPSQLRVGWKRSLHAGIVPGAFRWTFEGAALVYLGDYDARRKSATLYTYRPDLDLEQEVAKGVLSFSETSAPPGLAYVVDDEDGPKLLHARLK